MKTFVKAKKFVNNPEYFTRRQQILKSFDVNLIDTPVAEIIEKFLALPFCFTLQSCYGHFLYKGQSNPYSIEALPKSNNIKTVKYRIAYIAICIQECSKGKQLSEKLYDMSQIDKKYIQFGCAGWFWKRFLNSFVLQVGPERFSTEDKIFVEYKEALHIENVRNEFFKKLNILIDNIALK
ncbi:MAG: hypothetical protein FJW69_00575 [Actinobacteria bacterium]|nr:hypothetical protein [Actinomycetota bacterium]